MTANQMIAALQASVSSNGGNDVALSFKVNAAHAAGDTMSSVNSITYVGAVVTEFPGSPAVTTPALVTTLLP